MNNTEKIEKINKNRKRAKIMLLLMIGFMLYMIFSALVSVLNILFDWGLWWLEIVLYIGNVAGLGASIYTLFNALKVKLYFLWIIGWVGLVLNLYEIIEFLF